MSALEDALQQVLADPQKLNSIMEMAKGLGQSMPSQSSENLGPGLADPALMKKLTGFAAKNTIDPRQRQLLQALSPYLSQSRLSRLEKAMQAARLAAFATTLTGR